MDEENNIVIKKIRIVAKSATIEVTPSEAKNIQLGLEELLGLVMLHPKTGWAEVSMNPNLPYPIEWSSELAKTGNTVTINVA